MQAISLTDSVGPYTVGMQTGRPSKKKRPPFGERLHALRELAGLSQQQMADRLGLSQRAYAYWERNSVALRPEQLLKLADILEVSVEELLNATIQHNCEWLAQRREVSVGQRLQEAYQRALLALALLCDAYEHSFIAAPEFDPHYLHCGGYGYCCDYPVERYYRDVRGWSMAGGTTQMCLNRIAHEILK